MTGFTRVCEILGEEVAKEIGDCLVDAGNAALVETMRSGPPADPAPVLASAPVEVAAPVSLADVRKWLVKARTRRAKSEKRDQKIRGYILGALLDGEDLVPRVLRDDGTEESVALDGKPVNRDRAIAVAMAMVAFKLPVGTPFDFVRVLVRSSLSRMCTHGETVNDVERAAERAFLAALGKKVR